MKTVSAAIRKHTAGQGRQGMFVRTDWNIDSSRVSVGEGWEG